MDKKYTLVNVKFAATLSMTAILFFNSSMAQAYTLYHIQNAADGLCLPEQDSSPEEVLHRNGIKQSGNPTPEETTALAKGLAQVENLNGSPIPQSWRLNFNYMTATGDWDQSESRLNVKRPKGSDDGTNIGRLMHELGHKVGDSGVYQKYASYTGHARCAISEYATSKFNEEFAEVFSAYIVYPDLLEKKCPQAFSFMSTQLFPHTNDKVAFCKDNIESSEKVSKEDTVTSENGDEQADNNDKEKADDSKKSNIGKYLAIAGVVGVAGIAAVMALSGGKGKSSKKDKEDKEDRAPASTPAAASSTVVTPNAVVTTAVTPNASPVVSTSATATVSPAVSTAATGTASPAVSTAETPAVSATTPQATSAAMPHTVSTFAIPANSTAAVPATVSTQETEDDQVKAEKSDNSNNVADESVPTGDDN
ncbi:hypothetical protein CIK05_10510 [Bdellovibrio sp. qaytius]|nr:hypothetical protein CIK05_10510 [Bdellovibrio sp. qaytius]